MKSYEELKDEIVNLINDKREISSNLIREYNKSIPLQNYESVAILNAKISIEELEELEKQIRKLVSVINFEKTRC